MCVELSVVFHCIGMNGRVDMLDFQKETVRHRNKMASAKLAEEGAAASASACSGQAMADDRKVVASNTGEVKGDPSSLEIMQPDLGIAHPKSCSPILELHIQI